MGEAKKSQKAGRNKSSVKYKAEGRLRKNKIRTLTKRTKKFPNDLQAATDLKRWRMV